MKTGEAIAEIMKREGIEILFGYPVNSIFEFAAKAGIKPIIVRQERIGIHMADAISRLTSGKKIGAFAMQHGPGTENAFGGVAQSYSESVPVLIVPGGYDRRLENVDPNFSAVKNFTHVSKSVEQLIRQGSRECLPAGVHAIAQRTRRPLHRRSAQGSLERGGA